MKLTPFFSFLISPKSFPKIDYNICRCERGREITFPHILLQLYYCDGCCHADAYGRAATAAVAKATKWTRHGAAAGGEAEFCESAQFGEGVLYRFDSLLDDLCACGGYAHVDESSCDEEGYD